MKEKTLENLPAGVALLTAAESRSPEIRYALSQGALVRGAPVAPRVVMPAQLAEDPRAWVCAVHCAENGSCTVDEISVILCAALGNLETACEVIREGWDTQATLAEAASMLPNNSWLGRRSSAILADLAGNPWSVENSTFTVSCDEPASTAGRAIRPSIWAMGRRDDAERRRPRAQARGRRSAQSVMRVRRCGRRSSG